MTLHCYEDLMARTDENYDWQEFDEKTTSVFCYTSDMTRRPKGVLYAHRSAVLHAMTVNAVDGYAFSAVDRIFQATSMFHATSSAWPYCATMSGAALIMTGRWAGRSDRAANVEPCSVLMTIIRKSRRSGFDISLRCEMYSEMARLSGTGSGCRTGAFARARPGDLSRRHA